MNLRRLGDTIGHQIRLTVKPPFMATTFGVPLTSGDVVRFRFGQDGAECTLVGHSVESGISIVPDTDASKAKILEIYHHNLPHLGVVETASQSQATIRIFEFPTEHHVDEPVQICVDERFSAEFRRIETDCKGNRGEPPDHDVICAWLQKQFLIEIGSGVGVLLVSGGAALGGTQTTAFTIVGPDVTVDIGANREVGLSAIRVRPTSKWEQSRPIDLMALTARPGALTQSISFVPIARLDATRAAVPLSVGLLSSSASSYFDIWHTYNKLNLQREGARARAIGWVNYKRDRGHRGAEIRLRFENSQQSRAEDLANASSLSDWLSSEAESTLEASTILPDEHTLAPATGTTNPSVAVTIISFNVARGYVDVAVDDRDDVRLPEVGILHAPLTGARVSAERRNHASELIQRAKTPIPHLGKLLNGDPLLPRRRRTSRGTRLIKRYFLKNGDATPTPAQVEAVQMALETPDIALIQGPPGTGKTSVISALVQALADDRAYPNSPPRFRDILLTSYQHDAVTNLSDRTVVLGLPSVRLGSRRGADHDPFEFALDKWTHETVETIRSELENSAVPAGLAMRRLREIRQSAALGLPSTAQTHGQVEAVLNACKSLLQVHDPELLDQLTGFQERLASWGNQRWRANGEHSPEGAIAGQSGLSATSFPMGRRELLKLARGLRVSITGFEDDGVRAARLVRRAFEAGVHLRDDDGEVLERAMAWNEGDPLHFLTDLKRIQLSLVDRLTDGRRRGVTVVNDQFLHLVDSIITSLKRIERSDHFDQMVLWAYTDDIERDRARLKESLLEYSTSLAATIGQSSGRPVRAIKLGSAGQGEVAFGTVIVDEAARANPLDLFIPMTMARERIILVGDHRQLPHLLEPEVEREVVGSSDVGQDVAEALNKSLFERLILKMRAAEAQDGIRRVVTLDKQFRMHPVLGEFVSQAFYAPYGETFGSVREARDFAHDVPWLSGKVAAWIDVPASRGHESGRTSKVRPVEAQRVAVEVKRIGEASPHLTIGVITFYTAQRDAILSELRAHGIAEDDGNGAIRIREDWKATKKGDQLVERLRVGTVDAFQGLEFDVVLLSMTRSSRIQGDDDVSLRRRWGHLGLENRLCVALSRQRQALLVVGDSAMIQTARASTHVRGLHLFWNLCASANGVIIRE